MGFFSKFFSFTQELAIDLGTANTIIIADGEIAVNEPSVVALDQHTEKMMAVGDTAKLMLEKTGSKIRVIRPLRDGVIADFNACEQMMRGLIKKVRSGKRLFSPSLRMGHRCAFWKHRRRPASRARLSRTRRRTRRLPAL